MDNRRETRSKSQTAKTVPTVTSQLSSARANVRKVRLTELFWLCYTIVVYCAPCERVQLKHST